VGASGESPARAPGLPGRHTCVPRLSTHQFYLLYVDRPHSSFVETPELSKAWQAASVAPSNASTYRQQETTEVNTLALIIDNQWQSCFGLWPVLLQLLQEYSGRRRNPNPKTTSYLDQQPQLNTCILQYLLSLPRNGDEYWQ
jgi:hypothetical protein